MTVVKFFCNRCGIEETSVNVASHKPTQDVKWWVRRIVAGTVRARHKKLSPQCTGKATITTIEDN